MRSTKKHKLSSKNKVLSVKPKRPRPKSLPRAKYQALSIRRKKPKKPSSHLTIQPSNHPTKLELGLFSLIVFLIPTNLFFSLTKETAFVHGLLVDYLIPKIYLSDMLIGLLMIAWFTRLTFMAVKPKKFDGLTRKLPNLLHSLTSSISRFSPPPAQRVRPYHVTLFHSHFFLLIVYCSLFIVLSASAFLSSNPTSSFWFLAKLVEFSLLTLWIKTSLSSVNHIRRPLTLALLFQALVGLFQWAQKRSLLGYLFLGETTIKTTSHIAKTSLGGQIRPLPYGTTAHPNILAGFLAVGILLLLINHPPKLLLRNRLLLITFCLSLITLVLTQSLSAISALALGLLFLSLPSLPSKLRLLFFSSLFVGLISLPLVLWLALSGVEGLSGSLVHYESVSRRLQLAQISLTAFVHHPFFGVGPNNFTAVMTDYGDLPGTTRFLQPVHNIYLLLITETGLVGITAVVLLAAKLIASFDKRKNLSIPLTIPLLMLLLIGIFDHYPYSLQTGQLMLSLSAGLALTSLNPKNRANFKVIYK